MSAAAADFAVWRASTRAGWRITRAEIADATGLPVEAVREVIARRRWAGRYGARIPLADQAAPEVALVDPFTADLTEVIC